MLYLPSLRNIANRARSESLPIAIRYQVASDLQAVIAKELLKKPTAASERRLVMACQAFRAVMGRPIKVNREEEQPVAKPGNGHGREGWVEQLSL